MTHLTKYTEWDSISAIHNSTHLGIQQSAIVWPKIVCNLLFLENQANCSFVYASVCLCSTISIHEHSCPFSICSFISIYVCMTKRMQKSWWVFASPSVYIRLLQLVNLVEMSRLWLTFSFTSSVMNWSSSCSKPVVFIQQYIVLLQQLISCLPTTDVFTQQQTIFTWQQTLHLHTATVFTQQTGLQTDTHAMFTQQQRENLRMHKNDLFGVKHILSSPITQEEAGWLAWW